MRLEAELARRELRTKAARLRRAAITGALAGVLGLLALGFALAGAVAGIATAFPTWLALLIVAGGVALVAGLASAVALTAIRKMRPFLPSEALDEARQTLARLREHGGNGQSDG
jgi:hypothetical protein